MFPGGRGMNPKQMKAMMRRQGIDMDSVDDVEQVVVYTKDKEIVFRRPDVTAITAQGQVTYQVVGRPEERPRGGVSKEDAPEAPAAAPAKYSEDDVALVMGQTGASEEETRAALEECNGEVAEAIMRLIS
jgi:nascent polypeptide-associated complex subunit alpha